MTKQQIQLQLERVEQIQAELRCSILEDTLPGMEQLIDEMGTRLKMLLNGREPFDLLVPYRERLEKIVRANERLEALMQIQLKLVANRLEKTHITRQVFDIYAGETHRFKQLTQHAFDRDG